MFRISVSFLTQPVGLLRGPTTSKPPATLRVILRVSVPLWPTFLCVLSAQTTGLGTISFPTSGSPTAQPHFLRGVAWLHSFEYEEAIEAFRRAQRIDPDFAMAYWGEAMAYSQPLWRNENVAEARRILERVGPTSEARARKARLPVEKGFLRAVEALFGEGDRQTRDLAHSAAMKRLTEEHPTDHEAAVFYALALLGTASRGLASAEGTEGHAHALAGSETQKQAAAILERVLRENPQHPGAAHYLIHAYDDPAHAALALPVARAYARIAPAASHALHMPAHIFLQLGRWDEAAASDEAAYAASEAWVKRKRLPDTMRDYHSLSWLQYERLQQGRYREARETLAVIEPAAADGPSRLKAILASMRARQVVEAEDWQQMRGRRDYGNADELFAIGLSAAKTGDLAFAEVVRQRLVALRDSQQAGDREPILRIMEREIDAALQLASGRVADAIASAEAAASLEDRLPPPLGPPQPIKPALELLGEVLLEAGRPRDAAVWFERALQRFPGRALALRGLARAQREAAPTPMRRRETAFDRRLWLAPLAVASALVVWSLLRRWRAG